MTLPIRLTTPAANGLDQALAQLDAADLGPDELAGLTRINIALDGLLRIQRLGGEQGRIALDALRQIRDVK